LADWRSCIGLNLLHDESLNNDAIPAKYPTFNANAYAALATCGRWSSHSTNPKGKEKPSQELACPNLQQIQKYWALTHSDSGENSIYKRMIMTVEDPKSGATTLENLGIRWCNYIKPYVEHQA